MKKKYRLLVTLSFVLICVVALYTVMKLVEAHLIDANRLRLTAMCTIATIFIVYAIAIYMWKRSRKLQDVRADAALKEGEGMRMRRLERKLLFFLFILTIACIWLPLLTINVIRTNDDAFNYWWVFFSFIPIPTLSIILGKRDSKICLKSKKNVVSGYVVTAYLVFFGTVLFIIRQYVLLNG